MKAKERINILMVDDSPTNLLALESILRAPDRNLIRATSGEAALRYLLDNEAAVVLLDVYMPGIDGLQTAELIRGREKSRDIPIIFLTANSTGSRHLNRGYSLGAVDYIVKPIDPQILRSKVAVFVDLFKKTREVQRQARLLEEKNLELENTNLSRLNMLIDLGYQLAAEHEPLKVLEKFCYSARKIIDAEETVVGVLGADGRTPSLLFRANPSEGPNSDYKIPDVLQPALERLVAERRPVRLYDELLPSDELYLPAFTSFLGAPVLRGSGLFGWFYMLNKLDADEFSEADERLGVTLANQLGVAYENARLYTEAQSHASELRFEMAVRKQAEEERTRLLVREQAARADAERANRTKDEFLATLSHELRTPLTAILGWSHIVRANKLDSPQLSRALDTIERNARAQSQLIDDLLDVSRIISGKLQIERRAVDLLTVIEAAIESVRPASEAKGITIKTARPSAACPVPGDANRLQQIFWNLFTNAIKFTPKGGRIKISFERKGSQVRVSVADTGIGIDPEFLPYIFDRFRQADGSTTRSHGGLGLGLAIVRHLVELHQGNIEARSDGRYQGTTFTVTLPVARAATPYVADKTGVENSDSIAPSLLAGLKILVVDDEADARDLVFTILTRCGSEVRCSESAAEAIQTFAEWDPDLLVSDIGMPNEDGYSLIKRLRKLRSKRAKQIPAVALTAYATEEDRSMALSAGFQLHLVKPIEPHTLVKSIAAALGREESYK